MSPNLMILHLQPRVLRKPKEAFFWYFNSVDELKIKHILSLSLHSLIEDFVKTVHLKTNSPVEKRQKCSF